MIKIVAIFKSKPVRCTIGHSLEVLGIVGMLFTIIKLKPADDFLDRIIHQSMPILGNLPSPLGYSSTSSLIISFSIAMGLCALISTAGRLLVQSNRKPKGNGGQTINIVHGNVGTIGTSHGPTHFGNGDIN